MKINSQTDPLYGNFEITIFVEGFSNQNDYRIVFEPVSDVYAADKNTFMWKTVNTHKRMEIPIYDNISTDSVFFRYRFYQDSDSIESKQRIIYPLRNTKYKICLQLLYNGNWFTEDSVYIDYREPRFPVNGNPFFYDGCLIQNDIKLKFNLSNSSIMFKTTSMTEFAAFPSSENTYASLWGEETVVPIEYPLPPDVPSNFRIIGDVNEHPTLMWDSNTESDIEGYEIYCSFEGGQYSYLTSVNASTTSYTDNGVIISNGRLSPTVCYKICAVDSFNFKSDFTFPKCISFNGLNTFNGTESFNERVSIYPNPANPNAKIIFYSKKIQKITIDVYNLLGQKIVTIFNGKVNRGENIYDFDTTNLSSGNYVIIVTTNNNTYSQILKVLK